MKNLSKIVCPLLVTGLLGCATKDMPVYSEASRVQPQKQEERRSGSMTLSWTFTPNAENEWIYKMSFKKNPNSGTNSAGTNIITMTATISGLEPEGNYFSGIIRYDSEGNEIKVPYSVNLK